MANPILIYGAGGFGREVAALIHKINEKEFTWELLGFIDDGIPEGTNNEYGSVLGGISFLSKLEKPVAVVIAIASPSIIKRIVNALKDVLVYFPNIVAPDVLFFDKQNLIMGQGNLITFGCRFSINVKIGDFNILNGAVSLGHDVQLTDYNLLMPETRISGECHIGSENFFGVRSLVLQGIHIGNQTRIGAMSMVIRNTKDGLLYTGIPAKKTEF